MATYLLRPDGTIQAGWANVGAATRQDAVNEAVTQPTPGDATGRITATGPSICELSLPTATLTAGETVSQITLWWYCDNLSNSMNCAYDVRYGTTVLASISVPPSSSLIWRSGVYNGTITQAQLDDLRTLAQTTGSSNNLGAARGVTAYVEVTTTVTTTDSLTLNVAIASGTPGAAASSETTATAAASGNTASLAATPPAGTVAASGVGPAQAAAAAIGVVLAQGTAPAASVTATVGQAAASGVTPTAGGVASPATATATGLSPIGTESGVVPAVVQATGQLPAHATATSIPGGATATGQTAGQAAQPQIAVVTVVAPEPTAPTTDQLTLCTVQTVTGNQTATVATSPAVSTTTAPPVQTAVTTTTGSAQALGRDADSQTVEQTIVSVVIALGYAPTTLARQLPPRITKPTALTLEPHTAGLALTPQSQQLALTGLSLTLALTDPGCTVSLQDD